MFNPYVHSYSELYISVSVCLSVSIITQALVGNSWPPSWRQNLKPFLLNSIGILVLTRRYAFIRTWKYIFQITGPHTVTSKSLPLHIYIYSFYLHLALPVAYKNLLCHSKYNNPKKAINCLYLNSYVTFRKLVCISLHYHQKPREKHA